jgi:phosphopantothenoylcysteine decarboxylase/phosphopantothenate--cysteine ligase
MVKGKTILLGVSGGIAAYKAVSLCSALVQAGASVHVIMTKSAAEFVTPLTFQTISRNRVSTNTFEERNPAVVSHIDLADAADLVVIAPASANILAKMAHGIADDMLSTTLLATEAPIIAAPAMNVHMYAHAAVQHNMDTLRQRGVRFIDPGEGQLACGYVGKGRLAEPMDLFAAIEQFLASDQLLKGKRVLVTAGGTIERIDPVRYITNDSSGKMGFAIAQAARDMGAEVTLISANTQLPVPSGVSQVPVVSAQDMYEAVMVRMDAMDIIVKAAAVADYRPTQTAQHKIKKKEETLTLSLEKTTDILLAVGQRKTTQFVIGFAAETEDVEQHALAKLSKKNCDLLAANDVTMAGAGFGTDSNIISIYDKKGLVEALPILSKAEAAERILQIAAARLSNGGGD